MTRLLGGERGGNGSPDLMISLGLLHWLSYSDRGPPSCTCSYWQHCTCIQLGQAWYQSPNDNFTAPSSTRPTLKSMPSRHCPSSPLPHKPWGQADHPSAQRQYHTRTSEISPAGACTLPALPRTRAHSAPVLLSSTCNTPWCLSLSTKRGNQSTSLSQQPCIKHHRKILNGS